VTLSDRRIARVYGAVPGRRRRTLAAFVAEMRRDIPCFRHPTSSTERDMLRSSVRAEAIEAGLLEEWPAIEDVIREKLRDAPWTNVCGD